MAEPVAIRQNEKARMSRKASKPPTTRPGPGIKSGHIVDKGRCRPRGALKVRCTHFSKRPCAYDKKARQIRIEGYLTSIRVQIADHSHTNLGLARQDAKRMLSRTGHSSKLIDP